MIDFNAQVGNAKITAPGVLENISLEKQIPTGLPIARLTPYPLIYIVCDYGLNGILNATFFLDKVRKAGAGHGNHQMVNTITEIDYITVSSRWCSSIQNARAFSSADVGSDHQLLVANLQLKLRRRMGSTHYKRTDGKLFNDPRTRHT